MEGGRCASMFAWMPILEIPCVAEDLRREPQYPREEFGNLHDVHDDPTKPIIGRFSPP